MRNKKEINNNKKKRTFTKTQRSFPCDLWGFVLFPFIKFSCLNTLCAREISLCIYRAE